MGVPAFAVDHRHAKIFLSFQLSARCGGLTITLERVAFGIEGVPKHLCRHDSKRRIEVRDAMAERGLVSAEAAKIAARETRPAKEFIPLARLFPEWREQQARDLALRGAQQQVENTKTKVAVQSADDEARNSTQETGRRPVDPGEACPFLTPGYVQIYQPVSDMKPFSYKDLQSFGALNPDFDGLDRLAIVATAPGDKVRAHWKFNQKLYRRNPNEVE